MMNYLALRYLNLLQKHTMEFLEYELVITVRYNSDEQLCKDLYDFVRLHIKDDIMSYEEWIK